MTIDLPSPAITTAIHGYIQETSSLKARLVQIENSTRGKRTFSEVGTRLLVPHGSKGLARWAAQAYTGGSHQAATAQLDGEFTGLLNRIQNFLANISHTGPGYGLAKAGTIGNSQRLISKLKGVHQAKRLTTRLDRLHTLLVSLNGEPLLPNSEVVGWLEQQQKTKPRSAKARTKVERDVSTEHDTNVWDNLINLVHEINFKWQAKFGKRAGPLITDDSRALKEIARGCSTPKEFTHLIATLNNFVDGFRLESMDEIVSMHGQHLTKRTGTINALEISLKLVRPGYDPLIITNLRILRVLRSKRWPIHPDDPEKLQAALQKLGFNQSPAEGDTSEWWRLWNEVQKRFLLVLGRLNRVI